MKKALVVYYILLSVTCVCCCFNYWGLLILPSFFFFPLIFKGISENSVNGSIKQKESEYNNLCEKINNETIRYNKSVNQKKTEYDELLLRIEHENKRYKEYVKRFDSIKKSSSLLVTSGEDYERYVALTLALYHGYELLAFTKASNDYGVDILMLNPIGERVAIQCKWYSSYVGEDAIREVYAGLKVYACTKAVVCTTNGYTNSAKKLAEANNVSLMLITT